MGPVSALVCFLVGRSLALTALTNGDRQRPTRNIKTAVNSWISDPASAESDYGPIGVWDVAKVTNMEYLFQWKSSFNTDIGAWDTAKEAPWGLLGTTC
ncbi:hypothetical protein M885DRAFT_556227 [Pelagophyceae sp. CCMP2097]|nr:hypothetical protein M885DRAFT_556227 [Pelagophyceae sp. CCMP2097]